MKHSIYIVVDSGIVTQVFVNNEEPVRDELSVAVVNIDKESDNDEPAREYVAKHLSNSKTLTEILVQYPD